MSKILVIADADFESTTAIDKACEVNKKLNAEIHIVYFYQEEMRGFGSDGSIKRDRFLSILDKKAKDQIINLQSDAEISHEIVWCEDLTTWINKYSEKHQPLLLIKTGHRTERFLYTPTDWQLIRTCPTPLLLLTEQKWQKAEHILAAIDLGTKDPDKRKLNYKIVKQAKALSTLFDVDVHVAHAERFLHVLRDLGIHSTTDVETKASKYYKVEIDHIIETYGIDPDKFHVHAGNPDNVLPSLAAEYKASLTIIGSAGKQGLRQKILGNTAEDILKIIKTDMLILKV